MADLMLRWSESSVLLAASQAATLIAMTAISIGDTLSDARS
jgi:hypothetical protein